MSNPELSTSVTAPSAIAPEGAASAVPARLATYFATRKADVEAALESCLGDEASADPHLLAAMRHATLSGGKRLRPLMALAACECCGGETHDALGLACAVELIHTASLVHDDLPAMDDDDHRRGVPSVHRLYGEAVAVLAGDALITRAFEVAAGSAPDQVAIAVRCLARAAGALGMAGGQSLEIAARGAQGERRHGSQEGLLDEIHRLKAALLMEAALELGGLAGGGDEPQIRALTAYGRQLGLAYQAVDDLLDITSDQRLGQPSSVLLHGEEASARRARRAVEQAHQKLEPFGDRAWMLHDLADWVLSRGLLDQETHC